MELSCQEVVPETQFFGMEETQEDPEILFDGISYASSEATSRKTEKLAKLFPTGSCCFGAIEPDTRLHQVLFNVCKLPESFIACMMQVGFFTPHIIVN